MPPLKGHAAMTCRMHLINCRITFPGVQRHEAEAQCILELQTKANESPVKLELFHLTDTLKESEHMNAYIFHVFTARLGAQRGYD